MKKDMPDIFRLRVRQLPGELRGENRIEEVLKKNYKQGRDLSSLEILHQDRLLFSRNIPKGTNYLNASGRPFLKFRISTLK